MSNLSSEVLSPNPFGNDQAAFDPHQAFSGKEEIISEDIEEDVVNEIPHELY